MISATGSRTPSRHPLGPDLTKLHGGFDMRRTTWIVSAALVAACGGVTSPGGGGGGPVGNVTVGNILFRSVRNGSQNPAVDTIAAGDSITWAWKAAGSHSIPSSGTPDIFRDSVGMSEANDTYTVTVREPRTHTHQSAVHGAATTRRIGAR